MHLKQQPALNCYAEKDITMDNGQLQEKPDVLSSIQGLRKLVKADSVCICFVTKHYYTALPWFSLSLF